MSSETVIINERIQTIWRKNWSVWFLLAFALGLVMRLVLLNDVVYTQNELTLVNQALQVSQRMSQTTSSVPVYTGLTGFLFFLFGATDFLARLVPALAGASIVLLPWVWRERLGHKTALILGFALAFEPTFLLFSRSVNSGIFALSGLLWAFTFLKKDKPGLVGLSLAVAILGGVSFWAFLVIMLLTWLLIRILEPELAGELLKFEKGQERPGWAGYVVGFAVSSGLILTSFLLDPAGIGGIASSFLSFVATFSHSYDKPLYHSIYLLIARSHLPIVLFSIAIFRFRSPKIRSWYRVGGLSILISLLLSLILSRESFEILLWPVLVAWVGGAFWLGHWQLKHSESRLTTVLMMGFVFAILVYVSLNLKNLSEQIVGTPQFWNVFLMTVAGVIVLLIGWWLVRFSWPTARGNQIFLLVVLIFLVVTGLGSSFRSLSSEQQFRSLEYLDNQLILPNDDIDAILTDFTLSGKSLQKLGGFSLVDVPDDLAWYLRSFSIERNIKEKSLILTSDSSIPPQSEEFRGLNVVLERSVDWRSNAFTTYLQALVSKTPAFVDQKGILWVRTNLFTGASQ
ncbi:MAG TPA: hypothetical protein VFC66_02585 [Anaerolineaceae bacterium]|nr:hypothetical protein [Anaerolineaceae bacterium]